MEKSYNIRLSISDEGQVVVSRYYLKGVTNLMDVINALKIPMSYQDKKLVLVDMIDVPRTAGLMRGMLEYNMHLAAHFLMETTFDGCLTSTSRFPSADVHVTLGISKQQLRLTLLKLEKNGGTPFYSGPFREFEVDKCIKQFQFYFDDKTQKPGLI